MRSVMTIDQKGKVQDVMGQGQSHLNSADVLALNSRVELIRALVPIALEAVAEVLDQEVVHLAGRRYDRSGGQEGVCRWGHQQGSVYLGQQKVPIAVPRVRDLRARKEVPLDSYRQLQTAGPVEEGALRRVLKGLSCRDYGSCIESVPQAFGISPSSVSRRFIRASARQLKALTERDLSGYDLVAVLLDGKTFGDDEMVIALGVTLKGQKVILGFVQTGTENEAVCTAFLRSLVDRGLKREQGLLAVMDGSKGLRKAVQGVFGGHAEVQRCQWHKRENVVGYLPKGRQGEFRRKLQAAYEKPTYEQAKAALRKVKAELIVINQSAVTSLEEGLEETLTLHRLGVFKALGRSLKTTNGIENLNSLIERRTGKVRCWRNSDQKQRWLATALLEIEPRLRRIVGCRSLPQLRSALKAALMAQEAA